MCLIVFGYGVHKKYRLILSANRDEFFNRPTAPLNPWEDEPEIIGGRDLKQKGTWMAFNKIGRLAALTNVRDPASMKLDARSRGDLVASFLLSDKNPLSYLEKVKSRMHNYNGFNLLVADLKDMFFISSTDQKIIKIKHGIHAISNRTLNTPWVKVKIVKKGLKKILENQTGKMENHDDLESNLYSMMQNKTVAPDEELPDTGVGVELERQLSSIFISMPGYGTRSTSVVLWDFAGNQTFSEITWSANGRKQGYKKYKG
ncbi:conserved hypothetical protein [Desulfamplus magnetovallimortis]|uniref:NRDE family protein n=1 Tax=Desulfamplus magnetovallimortis TaxID=1246637 RepID=A0A1W1HAU6_9BACT|nr:NRDE family protein [Desulfamplus magnetovallimortis]SLM29566.1 conserved hypothetical protein [Desulfamplus magnetovallimortis]